MFVPMPLEMITKTEIKEKLKTEGVLIARDEVEKLTFLLPNQAFIVKAEGIHYRVKLLSVSDHADEFKKYCNLNGFKPNNSQIFSQFVSKKVIWK